MNRYRHEYKYVLDNFQKDILKVKIGKLLKLDKNASYNNQYIVRSLYLDNINNECLMDNIVSKDNRSKYRIRYYNNDISRIAFEKKTKTRGMCMKETCLISIDECNQIIKGNIPLVKKCDSSTKRKLFTEARMKGLMPSVIVTYVRIPYVHSCGNVRITFDEKITSSKEYNYFLRGNYCSRPILELGKSLLEVKWDTLLPNYIKEVLCLENLNWVAFSKYTICRIMHL